MATPNNRKRKRPTITLEEKHSFIEASKLKPKVSDLVTHFNDKYKYRTTDNIVKSNDTAQKAVDDRTSRKSRKMSQKFYYFAYFTPTSLPMFDQIASRC
jgi:hypothetical protein